MSLLLIGNYHAECVVSDAPDLPPKAGLEPFCEGEELTHGAGVAQKHNSSKKSFLSKDFTSRRRNFDRSCGPRSLCGLRSPRRQRVLVRGAVEMLCPAGGLRWTGVRALVAAFLAFLAGTASLAQPVGDIRVIPGPGIDAGGGTMPGALALAYQSNAQLNAQRAAARATALVSRLQ